MLFSRYEMEIAGNHASLIASPPHGSPGSHISFLAERKIIVVTVHVCTLDYR